jgi:4-amino-4-deoxy-L-arabinose transferase-like glycosyltransferase
MSTDEQAASGSRAVTGTGTGTESAADDGGAPEQRQPDWWHRDHPTFTALTGFFTGLAFVIVVPGLFAAILGLLFAYDRAEALFPYVLVTLAIPVGLVIAPRTRRFGLYMVIGMLTTALVVAGVTVLVLWYMVTYQS